MNYAQLKQYHDLLASIKEQIVQSQHKAFYSANATMLQMYWCIAVSYTHLTLPTILLV